MTEYEIIQFRELSEFDNLTDLKRIAFYRIRYRSFLYVKYHVKGSGAYVTVGKINGKEEIYRLEIPKKSNKKGKNRNI